MAAPTDNKGLDLAPDHGTSNSLMKFAVQGNSITGIIQKITFSDLSHSAEITGLDVNDTTKWVTPKAFTETLATESRVGTVELATDAEILNKTATKALIAGNVDKILESGIPLSTAIAGSDIDALTEGTLTNRDLRKLTYGTRGKIEGVFTFAPSVTTKTAKIYINNIIQPNDYINTGTGTITNVTDSPTELHSLGVKIESSGTSVSGGGQIIITLGQGSTAWNTSKLYAIGLNIDYSANI